MQGTIVRLQLRGGARVESGGGRKADPDRVQQSDLWAKKTVGSPNYNVEWGGFLYLQQQDQLSVQVAARLAGREGADLQGVHGGEQLTLRGAEQHRQQAAVAGEVGPGPDR